MRALQCVAFGAPSSVEICEVQEPSVGPDQVKVKVAGVGINPVDVKFVEGKASWLSIPLPATIGFEFSGVVTEVGAKAEGFEIGDGVFGTGMGTACDFVVVSPGQIAKAPASLDLPTAGAVPVVALTAWQSLFDLIKLEAGEKILIHAAAGGVGSSAVQLAKWKGAYVIGTGSASNEHFIRELGADEFIDYKAQKFEEAGPVDAVLDTLGGDTAARSMKAMKPGARLVNLSGMLDSAPFEAAGMKAVSHSMRPNSKQLSQIEGLIEDLRFRVVISGQAKLDKAGAALEELAGGHVRGKLLLLL